MQALFSSSFCVLLLAHGGPERLEDIPDFLAHIRHGRPISPAFLKEVEDRYQLIGGFSPLRKISQSLANKLSEAIEKPVYLGMRHWHPFIADTLKIIADDGHQKVIVICLAPHYSGLSIGQYRKALDEGNAALASPLEIKFVESWPTHHEFVTFHAQEILAARERLGAHDWSDVQVLFTAHSLPARILAQGDPYVEQLNKSVRAIAEVLSLPTPKLIFQSASPSPEPWLGPSLEEELELIAATSRHKTIICPIGFVSEHVEILYDLDIAAKALAQKLGLQVERTKMLNDRKEMVAILQSIVEDSAAKE